MEISSETVQPAENLGNFLPMGYRGWKSIDFTGFAQLIEKFRRDAYASIESKGWEFEGSVEDRDHTGGGEEEFEVTLTSMQACKVITRAVAAVSPRYYGDK